jgi:hypothetical protein
VAQASRAVGSFSVLKKHFLDIPDFPPHYSHDQAEATRRLSHRVNQRFGKKHDFQIFRS